MSRRPLILIVLAVLLVAAVTGAALAANRDEDEPFVTPDPAGIHYGAVAGNALALLPAPAAGEVSVVAAGFVALDGSGTPVGFVVYNGTTEPIANVAVDVVVQDAAGTLLGDIRTAAGQPWLLQPSGYAVLHGYPYGSIFGTAYSEDAVNQDIQVRWEDPATTPTNGDLDITEVTVTREGMVITATNVGQQDQEFAIAQVLCFDPAGTITDTVIAATHPGTVTAGATVTVTVPAERFEGGVPCATFLASAGGTIYS